MACAESALLHNPPQEGAVAGYGAAPMSSSANPRCNTGVFDRELSIELSSSLKELALPVSAPVVVGSASLSMSLRGPTAERILPSSATGMTISALGCSRDCPSDVLRASKSRVSAWSSERPSGAVPLDLASGISEGTLAMPSERRSSGARSEPIGARGTCALTAGRSMGGIGAAAACGSGGVQVPGKPRVELSTSDESAVLPTRGLSVSEALSSRTPAAELLYSSSRRTCVRMLAT
mmetsp:Transcript_20201/g.36616  ORF Transcript_20201/g.36616 Transcript_20201/m.36616 type:complete len:236 (-) Transcript_20201:531-1238(-)